MVRHNLPIFVSLFACAFADYREEPPVKLLSVESLAVRFAAAESEHRISIDNGEDELAQRTEGEMLNDFPEYKMILHPGGCASYSLPFKHDQAWSFVQPARKKGSLYEDYCSKGRLRVRAKAGDRETEFACFEDPTSCSSKSCLGDLSRVAPDDDDDDDGELSLRVCNDFDSAVDAAVWEINLSSSNDSNKLLAVFEDGARERLRGTQDVPEFDTQLTMVSVVGDRGVGKSTLTSLLSGNDTMFQTGSAATGTTTVGADISPTIPTKEYSDLLAEQLGVDDVYKPAETLPLFFIDSEGMNVRGEAFDFVTTSPPAVVAKVIIWVGSEKLVTAEILNDVGKYLDGLDNIVFAENDGNAVDDDGSSSCDEPKYGHFIIVINKLMSAVPDEQLYLELMTDEPDYIEGYEERNAIRKKLRTCFAGLSVHGLPVLNLEPGGQGVTYQALTTPFREGLAKIANAVLEASLVPKIVTVGSFSMELNSTNAEVVMATVITEANKGRLDLGGFGPFWTYVTSQVEIELDKAAKEMGSSAANCRELEDLGTKCTPCVCLFRNALVDAAYGDVVGVIARAEEEAGLVFEVDAGADAAALIYDVVDPWVRTQQCVEEDPDGQSETTGVCDFAVMAVSSASCRSAFFCGAIAVAHRETVAVSAEEIYVGEGSTLDLSAPPKAESGSDAQAHGGRGPNGSPGTKGTNFFLHANRTCRNSAGTVTVFARGGDGGDGGNGFAGPKGADGSDGADGETGADGTAGAPGADAEAVPSDLDPQDADAVVALGTQVSSEKTDCNSHCACFWEDYCTYYYHYEVRRSDESTGGAGGMGGDGKDGSPGGSGEDGERGGAGGSGGKGGKGGGCGDVQLIGPVDVTLSVQRMGGFGGKGGAGALGGRGGAGGHGGKGGDGGSAGEGGPGGYGRKQSKTFKAYEKEVENYDCSFIEFFDSCDADTVTKSTGGYQKTFGPLEKCCQGQTGSSGNGGKSGANGSNGNQGLPGQDGAAGVDGQNGNVSA